MYCGYLSRICFTIATRRATHVKNRMISNNELQVVKEERKWLWLRQTKHISTYLWKFVYPSEHMLLITSC